MKNVMETHTTIYIQMLILTYRKPIAQLKKNMVS